jgi:hypothetical protein
MDSVVLIVATQTLLPWSGRRETTPAAGRAAVRCRVPKLRGKTLRAAARSLRR